MAQRKFTIAAIAAAAIAAAPLIAPTIGAMTTTPVIAATNSTEIVSGTVTVATSRAPIFKTTSVFAWPSYYVSQGTQLTVTQRITANNRTLYMTKAREYIRATDVDDRGVYNSIDTPETGSFRTGRSGATVYNATGQPNGERVLANSIETYVATAKINGETYYKLSTGGYVKASDVTVYNPNASMGVVTVNYNPNYGIQIWHKDGTIVRYNVRDAAAWNSLHPNKRVKVGDAKKLPGRTSWRVFSNTYTANGTTYYNLGGDQYIDKNYVFLVR